MKVVNENDAPIGYKTIKAFSINDCSKCAFNHSDSIACKIEDETEFKLGKCIYFDREDKCDVYFIKENNEN